MEAAGIGGKLRDEKRQACGRRETDTGRRNEKMTLESLLADVRGCRTCADALPLGPRPVVQISSTARFLVASQAPGAKVHASGIPFDDLSGDRLREWMGVPPETFYDERMIAILPVGFCYPGRKGAGDAPPRRECTPFGALAFWRRCSTCA